MIRLRLAKLWDRMVNENYAHEHSEDCKICSYIDELEEITRDTPGEEDDRS